MRGAQHQLPLPLVSSTASSCASGVPQPCPAAGTCLQARGTGRDGGHGEKWGARGAERRPRGTPLQGANPAATSVPAPGASQGKGHRAPNGARGLPAALERDLGRICRSCSRDKGGRTTQHRLRSWGRSPGALSCFRQHPREPGTQLVLPLPRSPASLPRGAGQSCCSQGWSPPAPGPRGTAPLPGTPGAPRA